jgi:predicted lysophospholipase L1 biosynthesis ABC-type transport system permease subunit
MDDEEVAIERSLRRRAWVVPAITFAVALALYAALGGCLVLYRSSPWMAAVLAGLVAHAFMIVLVHDGAHRANHALGRRSLAVQRRGRRARDAALRRSISEVSPLASSPYERAARFRSSRRRRHGSTSEAVFFT